MNATKYSNREVPTISLADFDSRIDEITKQLVNASENVGFFCLTNHGISREQVDTIFDNSAAFFALPDESKARVPFSASSACTSRARVTCWPPCHAARGTCT